MTFLKYLFIVLLISKYLVSYCQSYSYQITDEQIEKVIKTAVSDFKNYDKNQIKKFPNKINVYFKPITWEASSFVVLATDSSSQRSLYFFENEPDSFRVKNQLYFQQQVNNVRSFTEWNFKHPLVKFCHENKPLPNKDVYCYSIPIFTRDHQRAIISKTRTCYKQDNFSRFIGGERCLLVYKKTPDNNWKLEKMTSCRVW